MVASRARIRLALGLAGCVGFGCVGNESPGEFGDDQGTDESAPPDLPVPECDPRLDHDDRCDENQKCSYVIDPELGPSNRCVPLLGARLEAEPCQQIGDSDDCGPHRICWATDPEGAGICVSFCDDVLDCELEQNLCSVSNDGLLPLCLPSCDPLEQDCMEGWGCYPDLGERWVCDRDQSGGLGLHADPCDCLNCCDPGLVCLTGSRVDADGCGGSDGAPGCCAAVCDLAEESESAGEGSCPTEAEQCEPYFSDDDVQIGLEDVGLCEV